MTKNLPDTIARYIDADLINVSQYRGVASKRAPVRIPLSKFVMFSNFLGPKDPWKAEGEDVAAWCAFRADNGLCAQTIKTDLHHLNYVFEKLGKGYFSGETGKGVIRPSPGREIVVRQMMQGIRTLHPAKIDTKRPISLDCLEAIMDIQPDNIVGLRNRALFSLIWAGAMRLTETLSLDMEPGPDSLGYAIIREDGITLVLNQSKTRRFPSVPEYYGIPNRPSAPKYCPVKLVNKWLRALGASYVPLFPALQQGGIRKNRRTGKMMVARALKESLQKLGLPAEEYSVRSFRSGCIQWLLDQGVRPSLVKEHSGHSSTASTIGYTRGGSFIETSPFMQTSWVRPR